MNDWKLAGLEGLPALNTVPCGSDVMTVELSRTFEQVAGIRVILDDQNLHRSLRERYRPTVLIGSSGW